MGRFIAFPNFFKLKNWSDQNVNPASEETLTAISSKIPASIDGKLPVLEVAENAVIQAGSALVPNGALTTVSSYTPGTSFNLFEWSATGTCDARFELWINGEKKLVRRSSAASRDVAHHFRAAIPISAGVTVEIKVFQDAEATAQSFDATIIGST